ncbi:MAG: hypothetical protein AAF322_11865 [Pseudomonadota bacterium]
MSRTAAALALASLALAACAAPADPFATNGFQKMRGSEIASALVGNSLDGEDKDGEYVIHYPSKSDMRIFYQGRVESGVWRIDGDRYCRRWESFGGGKERCVTFYRNGDRIDWVQDGEITDRSILTPGNPAAL